MSSASGVPAAPPSARSSLASAVAAPVRLRRGRITDARRLVRLYLGLSADARHGFHPFPFSRPRLWVLYPLTLGISRLGRPLMRRFPGLIVVVVVAELDGVDGFVGYGTLRGEKGPDGQPQVRFGFVVRDGFRGHRIGISLLHRLSVEGHDLGVRWGVGAVFRGDARAIKAIRGFGFRFSETTRIDPRAPQESNFETRLDLDEVVQREGPVPPPAVPAVPPASATPPDGQPATDESTSKIPSGGSSMPAERFSAAVTSEGQAAAAESR